VSQGRLKHRRWDYSLTYKEITLLLKLAQTLLLYNEEKRFINADYGNNK